MDPAPLVHRLSAKTEFIKAFNEMHNSADRQENWTISWEDDAGHQFICSNLDFILYYATFLLKTMLQLYKNITLSKN